MKKITLSIFIVLIAVQLSIGQDFRYDGFAVAENQKKQLSEMLSEYDLIEMNLKQFNTFLTKEGNEKNMSIALPSGKSFYFSLYKKDIRGSNYKSSVISEHGINEKEYDLEKTYTYRGNLTEGGFVRLTVKENFIYGLIDDKNGSYIIDQLKYVLDNPSIPDDQVIIYRSDSVYSDNGICFTDDTDGKDVPPMYSKAPNGLKSSVPTTCEILEVATDADYEYFLEHGGNAMTRILGEFNNIQGVYETTFDLDLVVVFQNVWTSSNDPYTSTNFAQINAEIETAWQNSFSNRNFDVIQMFTGKNLGGLLGRANDIGNVCQDDYANNYTVDVNLNNSYTVAHELGHNLGGTHPPLGEPTSFCAGNDNQRTVMCQGTNIARIVFSPFSTNQITNYINANSDCLNDFEGNYSINGPTNFCPSGFFEINNFPQNGTVTWSVSPSNSLSFTQGDPTTTFARIGSFSGFATITADVEVSCSNIIITKNVNVTEAPIDNVSFTNSADGEEYLCTSHYGNMYQIYPNISGATYQYRLRRYPNLNVVYTSPTGQFNTGTINYIPPQGFYEFQVRSTNACGTGPWTGWEVEYIDCSQGFRSSGSTMVYPNPTSTRLYFKRSGDNSASTKQKEPFRAELYDLSGILVEEYDYDDLNAESSMEVSKFKKGNYFLKIIAREIEDTHQIIIE